MYGLELGQNLNHKTLSPTFLIENNAILTTVIHKYINNILKCKIKHLLRNGFDWCLINDFIGMCHRKVQRFWITFKKIELEVCKQYQ